MKGANWVISRPNMFLCVCLCWCRRKECWWDMKHYQWSVCSQLNRYWVLVIVNLTPRELMLHQPWNSPHVTTFKCKTNDYNLRRHYVEKHQTFCANIPRDPRRGLQKCSWIASDNRSCTTMARSHYSIGELQQHSFTGNWQRKRHL